MLRYHTWSDIKNFTGLNQVTLMVMFLGEESSQFEWKRNRFFKKLEDKKTIKQQGVLVSSLISRPMELWAPSPSLARNLLNLNRKKFILRNLSPLFILATSSCLLVIYSLSPLEGDFLFKRATSLILHLILSVILSNLNDLNFSASFCLRTRASFMVSS